MKIDRNSWKMDKINQKGSTNFEKELQIDPQLRKICSKCIKFVKNYEEKCLKLRENWLEIWKKNHVKQLKIVWKFEKNR